MVTDILLLMQGVGSSFHLCLVPPWESSASVCSSLATELSGCTLDVTQSTLVAGFTALSHLPLPPHPSPGLNTLESSFFLYTGSVTKFCHLLPLSQSDATPPCCSPPVSPASPPSSTSRPSPEDDSKFFPVAPYPKSNLPNLASQSSASP